MKREGEYGKGFRSREGGGRGKGDREGGQVTKKAPNGGDKMVGNYL